MNRRQAIAALVSLPAVTRIARADLKPTDVIVIECDDHLSIETVNIIAETVKQVWPDHKCCVLEGGLRMKVVSNAQTS